MSDVEGGRPVTERSVTVGNMHRIGVRERGGRRRGGEGVIEGFLILLLQSVSSSLDIVFVYMCL